MKIELTQIIYEKDGKFLAESAPDSDMLLIMHTRTRRQNRSIAYNPHTKETFLFKPEYPRWDLKKQRMGEKIHLDQASLESFDMALAVFMSEEKELRQKTHIIRISPTLQEGTKNG